MAEKYNVGRRRFASGLIGTGAGLLAYELGARIYVDKHGVSWQWASGNAPSIPVGILPRTDAPAATQAPPTPNYSEINLDKIRRAEEGSTITLNKLEIQGFRRDTTRLPRTPLQDSEDIAIFARPGREGGPGFFYNGFIMGAKCLVDYARANGLYKNAKEFPNYSTKTDESTTWQLENPITLENAQVEVGKPIPGHEGGRILRLKSYTMSENSDTVKCTREAYPLVYWAIENAFLETEEAMYKERQKNATPITPSATPAP